MDLLFFRAPFFSRWPGCRYVLFALIMIPSFFFLSPASFCQALPLTVVVQGVDGDLHKNIMASLKIALQGDNPELTSRYIRKLHKSAPKQIAKALVPFGYYSVEVKEGGSLKKNDTGWHVVYEVDPGPPVFVDFLNIEITGPGQDQEILQGLAKTFPLQVGDQLNDSLYESGKKSILALALHSGYIKARFTENKVTVQRKKKLAKIRLSLESGSLFFFGETTSDQDIIVPEMLDRYIPYRSGDIYSLKSLSQFQSNLYATGYFSKVSLEPKLPELEDEEYIIPVEVSLLPNKKNRYSFGVGYGTDTGARGDIGWKNRIINRHGHKPSFDIKLAERGSRAEADYEIPVFDLRYDAVDLGVLFFDETWEDTKIKQFSLSTSANHNAPKTQFGVGLEYRYEDYTVGATSGIAKLLIPSGFLTMIMADDRIKTENGFRISASLKGANTGLFSNTSFLQVLVSGKAILTPWEKWRLIGRLSIGATTMDSIEELPPSLRFYAGGDQSVRGYGYKELGSEDASGKVVGGQYLTETSIELERKLSDTWSAAVFYDLGNAYDDIKADLKAGAGFGARMNLPFGQVRLDVACALSDGDYPVRIHLTIGADL